MAAGTPIRKIEYIVDVSTKGLRKGLGNADSMVDKAKGKIGKKITSLAKLAAKGIAVAAAAVTTLATKAVKGFAEYEQLVGGVETLFKKSSKDVMQYAKDAYKTAGLSANQYMETITGFSASLLQGLGGDTDKAAKIGNMAILGMADNANKMGTSMVSIQNAYQGFAKQNYTMLDNLKLGYGGTASEMARLINESGVMGNSFKATAKNVNSIPFDKMIEAIHKTQVEMGITGTTAQEASETISGSVNTMKASWENLSTSLAGDGTDIEKNLSNFIESVGTVAKNLIPVVKRALAGVVKIIIELAPLLIEQLPALIEELLPAILSAATDLFLQIVAMLPGLIEMVFNALVEALPKIIDALVVILPALLTALTNLVITIVKKLTEPATLTMLLDGAIKMFLALVKAIPEIVLALVNAFPQIIDSIITWLTDPNTIMMILDASVQLFMGIVKAVPKILGALVSAFFSLFANLWKGIANIFSNFGGEVGQAIGNAIKGGINGILGIIEGAVNLPFGLINGAIDIINLVPGVNIGKIPMINIPRLYTGGIVEPGGRIIHAGDGGEDEWIVPETKMASLIEKMGGGGSGGNITINLTGTFATSQSEQRKVAQQIADQIQMINRTRMGAGSML